MTTDLYIPANIATGRGGPVLPAEVTVPRTAVGVVVFAHGSGTSRNSPHNCLVAAKLQEARLATLLVDLLDEHEARDRHKVFDEELIATRLIYAARWLADQAATRSLALGYFGASTGAGAALIAAAREPQRVAAVVSRGGRPDMALSWLHRVHAPTLFIIGELDDMALDGNQDAYHRVPAERALIVVPGAGHLFEELGTLEEAADHARRWFVRHLAPGRTGFTLRNASPALTATSGAGHVQKP